jgi:hypothetical protein
MDAIYIDSYSVTLTRRSCSDTGFTIGAGGLDARNEFFFVQQARRDFRINP